MSARDSLQATLAVLKDCLNDQALVDKAPNATAHNARASMLRQGLAVLVFSTVETFIRERTAEVLQSFTNKRLAFTDLSPALQKASTIGAFEGVRFRLKLQSAADKIPWLVANLASIASTSKSVSALSTHSFGYAASNLDEDDVRDILKAFGVDAPWTQMIRLTSRFGLAILDPEAEFETVKKRRHTSAHALTATVLYTDLLNSVRSSLGICLAFDLLLSHAHGLFNRKEGPGHKGRPLMSHGDVELVFVGPRLGATTFAVRKEQLPPPAPVLSRPTVRVFSTEQGAATYGEQFARRRRSQLVVLDATSTPTRWATW